MSSTVVIPPNVTFENGVQGPLGAVTQQPGTVPAEGIVSSNQQQGVNDSVASQLASLTASLTTTTRGLALAYAVVVFRPGVVSKDNSVATWDEVKTVIAANSGVVRVLVDDRVAPAHVTSVTDCQQRVIIESGFTDFTLAEGAPAILTVDDGAQLLDLYAVGKRRGQRGRGRRRRLERARRERHRPVAGADRAASWGPMAPRAARGGSRSFTRSLHRHIT